MQHVSSILDGSAAAAAGHRQQGVVVKQGSSSLEEGSIVSQHWLQ